MRLEQDMEQVRRITIDVNRQERLDAARRELNEILDGVRAVLDNFEASPISNLDARDLHNYRNSLDRQRERLNVWEDRLERRFVQFNLEQSTVRRIRGDWELTRDAIGLDTLPAPAFEAGIARVIEAVSAAEVGLDSLLIEMLDVGQDLASTGSRIDSALDAIENVESVHRSRLLVRDAPPLWRPAAALAATPSVLGNLGADMRSEARAFFASLKADRDRLLLHFLLFVLVLLLLLRLRSASGSWPDEPSLETVRVILSRPYSAAALTALLATRWIYPFASFLVVDVMLILSLIPVVRLAPPLFAPERLRSAWGLLSLFLLSRLTELMPPESLVHRLAILGLAVGATVWAWSLYRTVQTHGESGLVGGRWQTVFPAGLKVALSISAVSAVLNVAGWTDLAETLIQGLIPSLYTLIVIVIGAVILIGVVRGLAFSPNLNRLRAFADNRDRIVGLVTLIIRFAAFFFWILSAFMWFDLSREFFTWIRSLLTHEFEIGAVDISIGSVLLFVLVIWLATWIGRIVRTLLRDDVLTRLSIPPGQADAWATLAQWAILVAGILFAAASAGFGGGQLAVLAGALGVGIGFGLQNIVNNFVSGFILIFEQPIKVGDKIEISALSLLGEVRRIGVRSSTIRTFDGADVVVPNSNLIQSEVINWTLSDSKRRFQVDVGVKYGTDPQRVIDLLLSVANQNPRILGYPEPQALFTGFGDSSLNFSLRAWSATFEDSIILKSNLGVAVNAALKAEGMEIPFPQRDLHIQSIAPGARVGGAVSTQESGPTPVPPATRDPLEEPGSPG
jgi:small-conductance mechanosensitive channel